MALTFKGTTIKCGDRHSTLHFTPGELVAQTTYFWGLDGTSEIVSGVGFGILEVSAWLNDSWTAAAGLVDLLDYIRTDLHKMRGTNGPVEETGTVNQKWTDCTFLGYELAILNGQERPSPVQLVDTQEWIQAVMLRWRALKGS